jgi:hypothetical protein
MANKQEEKMLTARDYQDMLDSLKKEFNALVRTVERKLGTSWTKIKNLLKGEDEAFALDVIDSFVIDTTAKFREMAAIVGTDLAGALYGAQQDLAALKVALIQAAAPLAQALVPLIRQAIGLLTGFAQSIGMVLESLFGGSNAAKQYAQSTRGAVSATQELKKSLAGFDQIQRLTDAGGSNLLPDLQEITPKWKAFAQDILALFEPFKKFDMGPAIESFEKLKKALEPITKTLFEGLNWAWQNLLVPLAQWAAEDLLPAFLELLTQALQSLKEIIEELKPAFMWLWEEFLQPMAQWYADKLISDIQTMTENFKGFSQWIQSASPTINSFLNTLKNAGFTLKDLNIESDQVAEVMIYVANSMKHFDTATQMAGPAVGTLVGSLELLAPLVLALTGNWELMEKATTGAWEAIRGKWADAASWFKNQVSNPMEQSAKDSANSMIGFFNGMLKSVSGSFNLLSQSVNSVKFTIPDWVPVLGGKSISFNLPGIQLPNIPLLAKGAVLPANKPFLAMVGDQKHGTNVEAPLSTIQEAVMLALEDRLDGVMAGFQAVTQRQEQILQAIFGLDISDSALAAAVQRHQGRMLTVTGGSL